MNNPNQGTSSEVRPSVTFPVACPVTSPFSVYCDWGMHDELGDSALLSAEMSHRALDALERWKRDYGIAFDYYLIDCFWFDPKRGYRHFNPELWPDGFEPIRKRIAALGMAPGLWFSTNGDRLSPPHWADSAAKDRPMYSLVDGGYGDDFQSSLLHAVEQWGVRFIKLDFANFDVAAAGVERAPDDTYRRSVRRLKQILRNVRQACPSVRIIGHVGYARAQQTIGPEGWAAPGHDPSWLEVLNHLFAGDPRPDDLPRWSIPRACDVYQDRQVYRLHRDGLPLHRIEDHGVMVGNTNTCFYRGRTGFRRSHLAQLARGGRRDFFYGDPTLLTQDDLRGLKQTRNLFFDAFNRGLETCFIGPGEPGIAPWHGYLTGGGDRGLLYLVNGKSLPQIADVILPGLFQAVALFHDGRDPVLQVQPDRLRIELMPEQVVLIGLGEYADPALHLGASGDVSPHRRRLLPVQFQPTADGLMGTINEALNEGEQLQIIVEVAEASANKGALRSLPHHFGRQNVRDDPLKRPATQRIVEITVHDGRDLIPYVRQTPDVPVWDGISWVQRCFDIQRPCTVQIRRNFPHAASHRLSVSAWAIEPSRE